MFRILSSLKWYWQVLIGLAFIAILTYGMNWFKARQYDKERVKSEELEKTLSSQRDLLLGQIAQRDKDIAALESQKEQYKVLAEQGVKLDQEHAKQIEQITEQEAQDLEKARTDMDCRTRAADTVALLRSAKPPINLNLEAVIRKQCGTGQ